MRCTIRLRIKRTTKIIRKIQASQLKVSAIPVKPNIAATMARRKKRTAAPHIYPPPNLNLIESGLETVRESPRHAHSDAALSGKLPESGSSTLAFG
jgi:hypothetical protein